MISDNTNGNIEPPTLNTGVLGWMKHNLFRGWFNGALTVLCVYVLWQVAVPVIRWAFIDSVWSGAAADCRSGDGACWSFIVHNFRFIIFGFYPYEQHWRPALALMLLIVLLVGSTRVRVWKLAHVCICIAAFAVMGILVKGGVLGLTPIKDNIWSGLPLTLYLSVSGIVLAYPFGILLALGRRSRLPAIKIFCAAYIEIIRGVPLISLLFMAAVMFPLFLPETTVIDKLPRAQCAIVMFAAAYLAEVVRGGLQAIPRGQHEAAHALGMNYFQTMRFIVLPQALKIVIPPTVSIFISTLKDTSLVVIIALFDVLNTTKSAMTNSDWLGFSAEGYTFTAMIYFVVCYSMSRCSLRLERELNPEKKR